MWSVRDSNPRPPACKPRRWRRPRTTADDDRHNHAGLRSLPGLSTAWLRDPFRHVWGMNGARRYRDHARVRCRSFASSARTGSVPGLTDAAAPIAGCPLLRQWRKGRLVGQVAGG